MTKDDLMRVEHINKSFDKKAYVIKDADFVIYKGDRIGIIGKSGCGKTTLAKLLVRLHPCDSGKIIYKGKDITNLSGRDLKTVRPDLQLAFQDYRQALPPHRKIGSILAEPLVVNKLMNKYDARRFVTDLLKKCGLPADVFDRYPRQLSGGQAQRAALARALAVDPALLILDEVTSGLDEKAADSILKLTRDLGNGTERSIIFISHDLKLVHKYCNRILCFETDGSLKE